MGERESGLIEGEMVGDDDTIGVEVNTFVVGRVAEKDAQGRVRS
jgi:hypothetical protein